MASYRVDKREKGKRRRNIIWLVVVLLLFGLGMQGWIWARHELRPKTSLKQAKAVTTTISYTAGNKRYQEPDFSISLPAGWQPVPRPPGTYQSYTWGTSTGTGGQQIVIFEDTIPEHFAVNRALIVKGEVDHLSLAGPASDNCANFTRGGSTIPSEPGALAKWQGVQFLCDQGNTERDVIGTSSTDGINTVILKNQRTGTTHRFFFTYNNQSLSTDYSVFYNALQSFSMN